jgi:hypothetical protein
LRDEGDESGFLPVRCTHAFEQPGSLGRPVRLSPIRRRERLRTGKPDSGVPSAAVKITSETSAGPALGSFCGASALIIGQSAKVTGGAGPSSVSATPRVTMDLLRRF